MANISKINLNGTEYNVHDSNAVLFTPQTLTAAQKQQARENIGAGTGGTSDAVLYTPQTLTTAQQAQARENIGAEAQTNKVTSLSASSTDTQYPSAKCVADMVAVWGVVSQTQTWTKASDGGYDYVMSNLQYGWIPKMFVDLVTTAGAIFNATSGYFELNGLTDLSYEEMRVIYNDTPRTARHLSRLFVGFKGRTNLSFIFTDTDGAVTDAVNNNFEDALFVNGLAGSKLEVFNVPYTTSQNISYTANFKNITSFTYAANYLRELKHPFIITGDISNFAFGNAVSLVDISIRQLKANIPFTKCSRLSVASILYMITNAANTSAITITLHATAYARAIADSDVQVALEAHPTITLASA